MKILVFSSCSGTVRERTCQKIAYKQSTKNAFCSPSRLPLLWSDLNVGVHNTNSAAYVRVLAHTGMSEDSSEQQISVTASNVSFETTPLLRDECQKEAQVLDDFLSNRPLELDTAGYWLIKIDDTRMEIIAEHYQNVINSEGFACDPESGDVIPCDGSYKPKPHHVIRGKSAKDVSVAMLESPQRETPLVILLTHANYLGRELQRAESCLFNSLPYIQD